MSNRLPTFSSIDRAMRCRASTCLPAADSVSDYAESGTVMHRYLQRVPEIGQEAALAEAPEDEQPFLAAIPVEELPTDPKQYAAEVALAFDAASGTAREIGRNLDRDYGSVRPTEFVGTVDLASLVGGDGVYVADWKKRGRYVKGAKDNWQIRAGIVAASIAWGRTRGCGSIIRIFEDGEVFRDRADFSPGDIEQDKYELTMLAVSITNDRRAYIQGEEIPAVTGSHCRYCPSFQFCPSNLSLARRLTTEPDVVRNEIVVSRETAPQVVIALRQIKQVAKTIEEALDALASQAAAAGQPIDMGDGTVYAPVPRNRESIDGVRAKAILEAELGEHAVAAISIDVTKSGIKKALQRKLNGARGISKAEEELLGKLRAAGAVKKSTSYSCDVTTPKKLNGAAA